MKIRRVKIIPRFDIIRDDVLIITLGFSGQDSSIYFGILNLILSLEFKRACSKKSRG